jgi:hypothetical protein
VRPRVVPLVIGALGFLLATAIAGQIIFHGQGDTPAISFYYGLLYIVYAGIPYALRGVYPDTVAVPCQLAVGAFFYWLGCCYVRAAWVLLALVAVALAGWLFIMSPQLFT